jgi:protein TonB
MHFPTALSPGVAVVRTKQGVVMIRPVVIPAAVSGSYGALELKHYYRKNMMLGVILAATAHLGVVGGILLWQSGIPVSLEAVPPEFYIIDDPSDLAPPPSIIFHGPQFRAAVPPVAQFLGGIPLPMPDEEVFEEVHFPTARELAERTLPVFGGTEPGEDSRVIIRIPVTEILPAPDEFVAFQEKPVTIHFETPVYPEMAELTGQSGTVWVRALVDKDGRVRDARIDRPSGTNAGFEAAALSAAFMNLYKPAIQNGQPVAVWISFKVEFKLR